MYNLSIQNREIPSFYFNFQSFSEQLHFDRKKFVHIPLSKMKIFTLLLFSVFLLEKDFDKKEREK